MNKPDTSDLHKFYTTLGLLIVFFSVIAFWAISNYNDIFLISNEELNSLNELSKEHITNKQKDFLCLYSNRICITISLFLFGGFFMIIGLVKWNHKQNIIDDTQAEDYKRLKMNEEISLNTKDLPPERTEIKNLTSINDGNIRLLSAYKEIEEKIFRTLKIRYKETYNIKTNVRFNNQAEYDVIMYPLKQDKKIIIIDIKCVNSSYNLERSYERFKLYINVIKKFINKEDLEKANYKILWVYNKKDMKAELEKYKKQLLEKETDLNIDIEIIYQSEIEQLKIE